MGVSFWLDTDKAPRDFVAEGQDTLRRVDEEIGKVEGVSGSKMIVENTEAPSGQLNYIDNIRKTKGRSWGWWYGAGTDNTIFDLNIANEDTYWTTVDELKRKHFWNDHWLEYLGSYGENPDGTWTTKWRYRHFSWACGVNISTRKKTGGELPWIWENKNHI